MSLMTTTNTMQVVVAPMVTDERGYTLPDRNVDGFLPRSTHTTESTAQRAAAKVPEAAFIQRWETESGSHRFAVMVPEAGEVARRKIENDARMAKWRADRDFRAALLGR